LYLASVNPLAVAVPVVSQGFVSPGIPKKTGRLISVDAVLSAS
jgi:hypothetical protein